MNPMDDDLRNELSDALKRRPAPAGFTERVMARIPTERPASRMSRWLAFAAMIALMIGGPFEYRRRSEQAERARQAREQLMFALQLTGVELQNARIKILKLSKQE
jgi:hypothetical protein